MTKWIILFSVEALNLEQNPSLLCFSASVIIKCDMDFVLYPLDVQKCAVDFSSCKYDSFFIPWLGSPSGPRPIHCSGFEVTLRHTTLGRTPLDKWSSRRRHLYLTTLTRDRHPCPRQDLNPQSQQASGPRPTPWSARPTGSASTLRYYIKNVGWINRQAGRHCVAKVNQCMLDNCKICSSTESKIRSEWVNILIKKSACLLWISNQLLSGSWWKNVPFMPTYNLTHEKLSLIANGSMKIDLPLLWRE